MNELSPAILILNELLNKSLSLSASDVHLEPNDSGLRVRFRIDGVLYDEKNIDSLYAQQVISRIKVLARMNVAEKRIPQDGQFCYEFENRKIDLRIATFPSYYGEKVVIRILDHKQHYLSLDMLGFNVQMLQNIKKIAQSSHGFFLVTGPTGSGKTTTLHAMLNLIISPEKNIVTLEDPIEYNVNGIVQSQIYPEVGFTFEKGIRSLLRQDPDVIMVGEIRDKETARVAIQAALTGHLVLSTLHTNDAPSSVIRLLDMNIEPFLINASLTAILAQRLARKLCIVCRYPVSPSYDELKFIETMKLNITNLYKSKGCEHCHKLGYKGRIGVFELLIVTNKLKSLITKQPIFQDIFMQARADGMKSLEEDAVDKINQGIISLYEFARVLF